VIIPGDRRGYRILGESGEHPARIRPHDDKGAGGPIDRSQSRKVVRLIGASA
jgi:hypothetical protein